MTNNTNITRPDLATLRTIPGVSPWDLTTMAIHFRGGSASAVQFEAPFCPNARVSLRPTELFADPEGRLWVGRRKRHDRPDGGKVVHLQPVLCWLQVMAPAPTPWGYQELRTEVVHLQAPEGLEAGAPRPHSPEAIARRKSNLASILARAQELVNQVEANPEYVVQREARILAEALRRKHEAEQEALELAELHRKVQEAEAWLASEGQGVTELKMLRSQPRKGQKWLEAWKRVLLPLLRPFGLGGRPADDLALRLGKELF